MGMTLLSSSGLLPKINHTQLTVALVTNNVAAAFAALETRVRRALVRAPSANAADVVIGPNNTASFETLKAGDEYLIESAAGHSFDLAAWYAVSTNNTATLVIIYQ